MSEPVQEWDKIILPHRGLFDISWRELWRYRDLVMWRGDVVIARCGDVGHDVEM